MNTKLNTQTIQICDVGTMPLSLNFVTVGEGKPKTFILAGLHGPERGAQLVLANLLRDLPDFKGSLTVLPVANPLGLAVGSREEPISHKNMNRWFPGKTNSEPVYKMTAKIYEIAQQHDYVIDLHGFETYGMVEALFMSNGNKEAGRGSLYLINSLDPEIIWYINTENYDEHKYDGTLAMNLAKNGIASIVVEMPKLEKITEKEVNHIVNGLKRHLQNAPSYEQNDLHRLRKKDFVSKRELRSPGTGIFEREPSLKLGKRVEKGQKIGQLIRIPRYKSEVIKSPYAGVVFELEREKQDVVVTGEVLVGIGEPIGQDLQERVFGLISL